MEIDFVHRLIYLLASAYITIVVGDAFFRSGAVFLLDVFQEDSQMGVVLNRFLLTGYYLINLGYVAIRMAYLPEAETYLNMVNHLSSELGFLMICLALMHYFNIWWIRHFHKHLHSLFNQS